MDAIGRLSYLHNDKGIATVYIAVLLVVLIAFAGLAIDLGYMYVSKGQLQNAADSAALAGAAKLDGSNFANQTSARNTAISFAAKNNAAGISVAISSDNGNTLSSGNDITVGNWDPNLSPKYLPGGDVSRPRINAVQVRTRRTDASDPGGASIGGRINLFLGKVIGWSDMGASSEAIAQRPARAGSYFMIGASTCTSSMPLTLQIGTGTAGNMAWTTILNNSTNANDVSALVCGDTVPNIDVCGHSLYTTQGTGTSVFKDIESAFYSTDYDRINKSLTTDINGNEIVSSWKVIVPVSSYANPADQPNPLPVWGYAKIRITRACGAGGGSPCQGAKSPPGVCTGGTTDIVIDQITCESCASSSNMLGSSPSLVQ